VAALALGGLAALAAPGRASGSLARRLPFGRSLSGVLAATGVLALAVAGLAFGQAERERRRR
jgi:hypothetical protein